VFGDAFADALVDMQAPDPIPFPAEMIRQRTALLKRSKFGRQKRCALALHQLFDQ
jgi:hypothetical protein